MKTSIPLLLSSLCYFVMVTLSCFTIGAHYGASPYRALVAQLPDRGAFLQIGLQQSQTLLLVSYITVGFSALGLAAMIYGLVRRKAPVHLLQSPVPTQVQES
jgi:hypothetical protein